MSRMKDLSIDIDERLGNNLHVHQTVYEALRNAILRAEHEAYQVHILLCDTDIVGVYANRSTAEYELHLCKQGDSYEGCSNHVYTLITKPVNTTNL